MQHNNNPIIGGSSSSSYVREVALPSCILIAALAIDTLAAWFIDIIEGPLVTAPGFAMFVAVSAAMYAASLYFLHGAVRRVTRGIRSRVLFLRAMYRVVAIAQLVMAGIIAIAILEMALQANTVLHG
jgi:hypothetical protein